MLKVSLRQIGYFVAAAETGSIAEAARIAGVAQPSVSWAILKMEEVLGVDLLVRHHAKGVSLTAAGHRLLPEARAILRMAEEFEASASSEANELTGTLSVGCYSTLAANFMPPIIAEFARRHPRLHIEMLESTVDDVLARLAGGEIEIALAYDVDLPPDVLKRHICSSAPYVLLCEGHRMLDHPALSLRDLADEPFILLNSRPAKQYFLGLFEAVGIEPRIVHASPSFEVVRSLVGQGLGYSVLITRSPSDMTYDGLRVRHRALTDELPRQSMCTVRAAGSRATRRANAFQEICVELFSGRSDPVRAVSSRT
ncbi:MAG: LysR family transcriptional regulator [Acetobacteraceae bacterium]|nr:LysR family transcriptional regulator [Acetobacteraceae bacterium]